MNKIFDELINLWNEIIIEWGITPYEAKVDSLGWDNIWLWFGIKCCGKKCLDFRHPTPFFCTMWSGN